MPARLTSAARGVFFRQPMPNRYIRASAIESEAMNALSWHAEVFYRRLLNRCDDFGRFTGNPALIRAALFPLQLQRVSEADVRRLIAECEACGLLFQYAAAGKPYVVINKWERGRAKTSEFPPPPADVCERMQTYVYTCKQKRAHAPDSDSDSDSDTDADTDTDSDPLFDRFWAAYPRKAGKQDARKAFAKVGDKERVIQSATAYAEAVKLWSEQDLKYVPHPASWLNKGHYDDDPATWTRDTGQLNRDIAADTVRSQGW